MRVLSIDTALGQCGACVVDTDAAAPLSVRSELMERGHAEALLPLLDAVMASVDGGFPALDRVAVTVGPGSFTGIRVGIAAARAIGLALGKPVIGVSTLSVLMAPLVDAKAQRLVVAAIDARGGRVFAQAISPSGRMIVRPALLTVREVVRAFGSGQVLLTGPGAGLLEADARAFGVEARIAPGSAVPDLAWVARLGAAADPATALAKPLYLAPPDARPQDAGRLARR